MSDKTKGTCTGCGFEYALSAKGLIRKHLSRTGPGECTGSRGMPKQPEPQPEPEPDPFTTPGPRSDVPESTTTVSGQPEPDRDRWRRYLIGGQPHTRATTFAKLGSNTKAIEQWGHRNVVVGLTRRPDLLALADGMQVKRDREQLNSIVEQAKDAAGQKVSANIGTAYHAFTERLDAGLLAESDIPEAYRARVMQYADAVKAAGLTTRPEWIERTTAVRADMVSAPLPVAGTFDRIFELPSGELVIGDLKTGSDLSYGMAEIEVQLALYANGANTFGLFDWNTKTWDVLDRRVRTDFAIVIHLPADGVGCTLLRVDIERGWRAARLRGLLQADQKDKRNIQTLSKADLLCPGSPTPADPWAPEHMAFARPHFLSADSKARLAELYQFALDSGKYTQDELSLLVSVGTKRLRELG
jgi:hypothetical protein